jgi:hypothetical protein
MEVRILKRCFSLREKRWCEPGEIVEVTAYPSAAIEAGLVEAIVPVPENVPDLYPD